MPNTNPLIPVFVVDESDGSPIATIQLHTDIVQRLRERTCAKFVMASPQPNKLDGSSLDTYRVDIGYTEVKFPTGVAPFIVVLTFSSPDSVEMLRTAGVGQQHDTYARQNAELIRSFVSGISASVR